MLRSKSRSGSVDFRQSSNHHSVFARTISASKLCRGDALGSQIDAEAVVSLQRKPSKTEESGINRVTVVLQKQMGELEEELRDTKQKLCSAEEDRNQALRELREIKEVVQEIKSLKDLLSCTREESNAKDKDIQSLRAELDSARDFELKLLQRDSSLERLKEELGDAARDLLDDHRRKIQELEDEVEDRKLSECQALDSLESQTKAFEQTKIELEEHKERIGSLVERIQLLEANSRKKRSQSSDSSDDDFRHSKREEPELRVLKQKLAKSEESERIALSKVSRLTDELNTLKNELKYATGAEEQSSMAMDDLALALKEVATECAETKEKLFTTKSELDQVKEELQKYEKLLDEAKNEIELHKKTAERLRSEAEDTLFAWNGKEMGFVTCIKRAEEERALAQHENTRLAEALKAAEHMTRAAREETYKLRDIMKQAVNEATAAKSAADIARAENSQLKDLLTDKDEAVHFLSRENERLRINEAAANENAKQYKLMLSYVSQELKVEERDHEGMKTPNTDSEGHEDEEEEEEVEEEDEDEENKEDRKFSIDLRELALLKEDEDDTQSRIEHEDPEKAEALKGSIFDTPYSPKSEPRTPKQQPVHHRRKSTAFADAEDSPNTEDAGETIDNSHHVDESDSEKNSHRRKKALLRRVGDLILRKSFSRKEPSPVPPSSPAAHTSSPALE
ncbi:PREDICTED: WEB family protein At5g16730, chloroplastic isoform X2 [Ipomoea nil]|uniref:WEB family protein At5g16730, chloroplastic isoform X2 n=1 Tax=Ipomoea nil TaxID=35883 RepID=UPI000900EF12|nr:PREDICTED: WEB family protein At5g16730, chloroplastic isoform X2 [Ipomoea nil]